MTKLVEANGVTVRFGAVEAVRAVEFELEGGQVLGLIGPNGAGKTTLLRAVAGLQRLSAGRVTVMGRTVDAAGPEWAVRAHIGFAPDDPPVYPELTVERFLQFIGRAYAMSGPEIDEAIEFWLDRLWLAEKRESPIGTLSRGMRQRLTIARSLLANPSVILLDEPASGLDPAGRVQFRGLLSALREQGKALIVSSHILADLPEFCTHVAIMERGAFVRHGTVAAVTQEAEGDEAAGERRCRYRVTVVQPTPNLGRVLAAAEVDRLDVDGTQATFVYDAEPKAAASLLRQLVSEGIEVTSMAPVAADLEAAYLKAGVRQVD